MLTLADVVQGLTDDRPLELERQPTEVVVDSRQVTPGGVFVALRGDRADGHDFVKDALENLPYQFRLVVLLCDVEGFSYNEIASIIDAPLGTVMSRLYRGRKLLQRYLWNYAKKRGYVLDGETEE